MLVEIKSREVREFANFSRKIRGERPVRGFLSALEPILIDLQGPDLGFQGGRGHAKLRCRAQGSRDSAVGLRQRRLDYFLLFSG